MRQYPILERCWDPEENFEILNKKKTPKVDYLAMPETYGNIHICKKASKAVNKLTPINRWGGGANRPLWVFGRPTALNSLLDPPAITSNISLASVV